MSGVWFRIAISCTALALQDVRDSLPESSAKSYRAILASAKESDLSKATAPMANLRRLAEHLDQRYGVALSFRIDKGMKSIDELKLWTAAMVFMSVSLSFDLALEDLSRDQEVRKTIRFAYEEFVEIEHVMKAAGDNGFKQAIEVRKSIQRSMFLLKDGPKFAANALHVRKAMASVFPEAAAWCLRASLLAALKDGKYRPSATAQFRALEEVLKAQGEDKLQTVAKGVQGDADSAQVAIRTLEEVFPGIKKLE